MVAILPDNMHTVTFVKCVDDGLLDCLVYLIIQCIDTNRFSKYLFKIFTDLRYRISNDRKTSLIPTDIAVGDLAYFILHTGQKFLLMRCVSQTFRFADRHECCFTKGINTSRTGIHSSSLLDFFVSHLGHTQLATDKIIVQKQCIICSVIIDKLWIGRCGYIADPRYLTTADRMLGIAEHCRLKSHVFKLSDSSTHHTFKTDRIADFHSFFL